MKIPEIAARIRQIADDIEGDVPEAADELRELADQTRRRSPRSRAQATSTPMTPELRAEIREYRRSHPALSQQQIAVEFGVNHGRVSETLRGFRT